MIPSVNFHLTEKCNMRCKYCFATFQDAARNATSKNNLDRNHAKELIAELAAMGFEKISFAGGEPTLVPWLPELIETAKDAGMTTMLITNGSRLSDSFLKNSMNHLDWISISIDSLDATKNKLIGRVVKNQPLPESDFYLSMAQRIKRYGYGLKINTVVTNVNRDDSMHDFIECAKPDRWKIFQVLSVKGENYQSIDQFSISNRQFRYFIENHKDLQHITKMVPETCTDMINSYVMIDPKGRFYTNVTGKLTYSQPIPKIGARLAIQQMGYNTEKFYARGGIYDWNISKNNPFTKHKTA